MDFEMIFQEWLTSAVLFLPKLVAGIVIFILALVAAGFVSKAVRRVVSNRIESEAVEKLIGQIVQWTVIVLGTVIALDQVDFNVTGFIAGLGIAGFTIGFSLQDIARNFISGLILLYRQPFQLGDFIEVSGQMGKVSMINIRDTEIVTLDGDVVIIPNNRVIENPIINLSSGQFRRRTVAIGLGYEEDVERAMEIFLEAVRNVAGVETEPEPMIQVMSMDDSDLALRLFYWVDQKQNSPLKVHTEVLKAVNRASHEHQINLPYPTQKVLVQQADGTDQR